MQSWAHNFIDKLLRIIQQMFSWKQSYLIAMLTNRKKNATMFPIGK